MQGKAESINNAQEQHITHSKHMLAANNISVDAIRTLMHVVCDESLARCAGADVVAFVAS